MDDDEIIVTSPGSLNRSSPEAAIEAIPPTSLQSKKKTRHRRTEFELLEIEKSNALATLHIVGRTAFTTDPRYATEARVLGIKASEGTNNAATDPGKMKAQQHPPPSDNSAQQNGHLDNDSEQVSKPTKAVKLRHEYAPPAANKEELEDDLEDFGFDQTRVKGLMSRRESNFDTTMQRPHLQTREDREHERNRLLNGSSQRRTNGWKPVARPTRDGQQPVKKRKISGEGLVIGGSGNWILFDPISHTVQLTNGKELTPIELPPIYQKYMRYEPGNARIVEINLSRDCVRLKSTPESLRNKVITYTSEGPKISGQQPLLQSNSHTQSLPQSQQPPPKRGPSRPRKQGGRGGRSMRGGRGTAINLTSTAATNGGMSSPKSGANGTFKTTTAAAARPARKPATTVQVAEESESGSESPLTDIEESIEIGDSQEGDSSLGSLAGEF